MTPQELFEEMKNDYEIFCRSAQRFMDSVKEQQEIKTDTPDYKSWVGKVVYVWDANCENKQKTILLDYVPNSAFPFRVAGTGFENAELCARKDGKVLRGACSKAILHIALMCPQKWRRRSGSVLGQRYFRWDLPVSRPKLALK